MKEKKSKNNMTNQQYDPNPGARPENQNAGNKNKKGGSNLFGFILYYFAFVLIMTVVFNLFFDPYQTTIVDYSEFESMAEQGLITDLEVSQDKIYFYTQDLTAEDPTTATQLSYSTDRIYDPDLLDHLKEWQIPTYSGVPIQKKPFMNFIFSWVLPVLFFVFLFRLLTKNMKGMGMPKSSVKEYNVDNHVDIRFSDVAGQDEAKESLKEIVDYLHNPEKYMDIGAKLPKGELLVGPPGTGKTLLAKAVAGEADVPFFTISGSEFVQMYVGMGAARVRELFETAKKKSPCIIFIDEIDAIGKARDNKGLGGNDEREQTLNQLLTEMDGFDSTRNVIVILAATNRPEVLDEALLRPGRFDRRVIVSRPDFGGRKKILSLHLKNIKYDDSVDLDEITKMTSGSSGADLANIVNESALRAVRKGEKKVTQKDIEESVEVVFAGEAKKDRIMSQQERESVAYHETGHALAGALQAHADPVSKITIVPTTMGALGYTLQLPTQEKYLVSKEELMDKIVVMLAGRAAEEVKFNQVSTGASNDIEKATQVARSMITVYGMSERFDMMGLEKASSQHMNGAAYQTYSADTGKIIDEEILSIIKTCHEKAKALLRDNMALLDEVAHILLEKENISGKEFYDIVYKYTGTEEPPHDEKA